MQRYILLQASINWRKRGDVIGGWGDGRSNCIAIDGNLSSISLTFLIWPSSLLSFFWLLQHFVCQPHPNRGEDGHYLQLLPKILIKHISLCMIYSLNFLFFLPLLLVAFPCDDANLGKLHFNVRTLSVFPTGLITLC